MALTKAPLLRHDLHFHGKEGGFDENGESDELAV